MYQDPAWIEHQRKRWMRPDAERYMRHDAYRFYKPPYDLKYLADKARQAASVNQRAAGVNDGAVSATELEIIQQEHLLLRSMVADLKLDLLRQEFGRKAFYVGQPRVPAGNPDGGQWTNGDDGQARVQPAFFDPRREAIRRAIEAATALFTGLSARNGPDQQAVIAFKARDFRPGEGGGTDLESVGLLDRDKVNAECPRLGEVQARTNAAAAAVDREGGNFTPATYGTAVHTNLKRQIDDLDDPNFKAEKSFLKAQQEVRYGAKDSIRVDVLENVGNGTVCVYDIKTGERGLSMARTVEIAREVQASYVGTRRIIITEVRPRR